MVARVFINNTIYMLLCSNALSDSTPTPQWMDALTLPSLEATDYKYLAEAPLSKHHLMLMLTLTPKPLSVYSSS